MRRVVVMGVAGCGKSSVGQALAARLGAVYLEGDAFHSPGAIAKMSRGEPLSDSDRAPWLDAVGAAVAAAGPAVVASCSALRRTYRDRLRAAAAGPLIFVHLTGSREVIASRMKAREGHFMPASLLDSQFSALEPPGPDEGALSVDIDCGLDELVDAICAGLDERAP